MTKEENSIVRLLAELRVFDEGDVARIKKDHGESIVAVLVQKEAVAESEYESAGKIITELSECSSATKRLESKMKLIKMVTSNVHKRLETSAKRIRTHRDRVTSGSFPSVAALAKPSGD